MRKKLLGNYNQHLNSKLMKKEPYQSPQVISLYCILFATLKNIVFQTFIFFGSNRQIL